MKNRLLTLLAGAVLLGAARFTAAPLNHTTHFHANWAVFTHGARIDLSDDRFMQEIGACTASYAGILPEERVHLHENNPDVVHVHHDGVTWGHLFANLGMALGDDFLHLATGERFVAGAEGDADGAAGALVFILNGLPVPSVHNRLIRSGDRLLVSVTGEPPARVLETEYPQVADDAEAYNQAQDPSSCTGGHGELPLLTRLRLAFWG
ncbi:MAG: hypothetical protein RQ751_12300 [Longimicrobiales bacterium]|nr:hypothetical protein [Longimicrobiales bacterium]